MSRVDDAETRPSRFVVGIDLGTTNSAMAFVDTHETPWSVRTFLTPQFVAPSVVEARETLPSFHYEAAAHEFAPGALRLPWLADEPRYAVGVLARDHGATVEARLIASAKSWLCHGGVDRTAALLPWHAADDVERLSPVEASSRYLAHFRQAWNAAHGDDPLETQDVVLTLPASFDEVARELTVKAARAAGLERVVLLEEPQAAFYAWLNKHGDAWGDLVHVGQKILVCDIGGGTTDLTLIRVRGDAAAKVKFHRVAVGEHLILGGDNLDLALAHHVENRLTSGGKLDARQWNVLVRVCRQAKETLLGASPPEHYVLHLPSSGSRLIGRGLQIEVTREEAQATLVDGFLPRVRLDERPIARRSGFQEFGLPYAADAAITRYLAAFLTAHRHVALDDAATAADGDHDPARPDVVLFNGGLFESPMLKARLVEVLSSWFSPHGGRAWQPVVLDNDRLDLAVARGAAYYGMVRRGAGVRISAGLARTYYVGVAQEPAASPDIEPAARDGSVATETAVCLVPAGLEEGQTIDLAHRRFNLRIREPVEFPLYVSSTRLIDPPGLVVDVDREQMSVLPPIRTVLETAKRGAADQVAVELHTRLSEIGTLDLWCSELGGSRTWRLVFDVRAATQTDRAGHAGAAEREGVLDQALVDACVAEIRATYATGAGGAAKPDDLMKRLERAAGMSRRSWPSSLLRSLWETLMEVEPGRRKTAVHEARWLYLTGFSLRPGYGLALDDWRVAQTWRALQGKRSHHTPQCRVEWLVLWRRVAGGLSAGQQKAIADPLLAPLRQSMAARGKPRRVDFGLGSHEAAEVWRLLGSLEWLAAPTKTEIARTLVDLLPREKVAAVQSAQAWAIGRLGARRPMYGPLNTVVAHELASEWAEELMRIDAAPEATAFALVQLTLRTGDRYRDVDDAVRGKVLKWLARNGSPEHYRKLVESGGELEEDERGMMFGESLPHGLKLIASS